MQVIIARKTGKTYTLEEFISGCWDHQENAEDEINSRRWAWLLYASLLMRLEKLARDNSETAEIGAQIWCSIAQDAPRLKVLLPNNVVWKPDEKTWFDLTLEDDEIVRVTINVFMPSEFAEIKSVFDFARSKGFLFFHTG